ncbi:MAG: DUF445 domain-containing protein [Chitinophagaceae bacterium]
MNYWLLILLPATTAFAGWLTIRVAIKMLFHPRQPKNILGFRVQGIYPKQQKQIAVKLGNFISQGSLFDTLEQKINNPGNLEKIMPLVENHIDDFLRNRLSAEMPMISMFIGDKTIAKLKEAFLKEIQLLFPQVMKEYAAGLRKEIKPAELIEKYLADIPAEKMEKKFLQTLSKELRLATIAGALIGLIIGLFQLAILLLITSYT